eukprot:Gb_25084 [translate_table: standard]
MTLRMESLAGKNRTKSGTLAQSQTFTQFWTNSWYIMIFQTFCNQGQPGIEKMDYWMV